jgi:hypothetical protein
MTGIALLLKDLGRTMDEMISDQRVERHFIRFCVYKNWKPTWNLPCGEAPLATPNLPRIHVACALLPSDYCLPGAIADKLNRDSGLRFGFAHDHRRFLPS